MSHRGQSKSPSVDPIRPETPSETWTRTTPCWFYDRSVWESSWVQSCVLTVLISHIDRVSLSLSLRLVKVTVQPLQAHRLCTFQLFIKRTWISTIQWLNWGKKSQQWAENDKFKSRVAEQTPHHQSALKIATVCDTFGGFLGLKRQNASHLIGIW